MKKLALALGILLTTTVTAQSATIMAKGFRNGVQIADTGVLPIPGATCALAVSTFSRGVETQMGTFHKEPLKYVSTTKEGIKLYAAVTSNNIDFLIVCAEDGVML